VVDLLKRQLTDSDLAEYFLQLDVKPEKVDDNYRTEALILQQTDPEKGYPRLVKNMQTYGQGLSVEIPVNSIPIRIMMNKTRVQSLTSSTFEKATKTEAPKCFLCSLDKGQRGILTNDQQYLILTNPGITLPGDLTIAAVKHDYQMITNRFEDMIRVARSLYHFSIYFNGALAGASSPHFHFQAGYKDKLIGEIQIQKLLGGQAVGPARLRRIIKRAGTEVFNVENFLRPAHIIVTKDAEALLVYFQRYLTILKQVNQDIKGIANVPDFGDLIPSLKIIESEPRLNIMLKYYPDYDGFILALFPKIYNRPQCYFQKGDNQILLGLAIKEALGNLITVRESDFNKLTADPEFITRIYTDTSITPEMVEKLNNLLKKYS